MSRAGLVDHNASNLGAESRDPANPQTARSAPRRASPEISRHRMRVGAPHGAQIGPWRSGATGLCGREPRRSRAASLRPSVINDLAPVFLQWRRHRATIKSRFGLHRSNGRVQSPRPSRTFHCRAVGTWEGYNFLDAEFPVATSDVRITAVRRAPMMANGEMLHLK